ncbi:MAG: type IX secretion system sortase PorU [Candidatus Cloacimonetes bacterium]|nr:type IX secretion system sortase PorU [Candidatus Cloacimonadota bacterium]MBL7085560.1 type IX secretion system sortase PorU [Candidatus Cloacimonadota bacterium]
MKKQLLILFLFFNFTFLFENLIGNSLNVIESNTNFLILKFKLEDYDIRYTENFSFINAKNLTYKEIEGDARLPVYIFTVGIPPEGQINYTKFETNVTSTTLKYPVAPYPKFIKTQESETCQLVYQINPDTYYNTLSPELIEISEPYYWRNQRVVKFIINPFSVENNQLIITGQFKLKINFPGNGSNKNVFKDKNFENIFKNSITNFNIAKYWSIERKREVPDNPFSHADRWFKIPITQDGIYKITKSELANAGIFVDDLAPESIKIFNGGGYSLNRNSYTGPTDLREIPVFLSQFGDDFSIYFYARDTNGSKMNPYYSSQYYNPYTGENIYWLTYNTDFTNKTEKKLILNSKPTIPKEELLQSYHFTVHFEEENLREDSNGIKWFWKNMSSGSLYNFSFTVSNLVENENQKIELKFNTGLYSGTTIKVNNETPDITWGNPVYLEGNFLKNGNNSIIISPSKSLYFDYYKVEYDKNLSMENNRVAFSLPQTNTEYEIEIDNVQNNELYIFKIKDFDDVDTISSENYNYNPESNTLTFINSITNLNTKYYAVCYGGYLTPTEIIEVILHEREVYYSYNQNGQVVGEDKDCYLRDNIELANTDVIIITPEVLYEKSKELADLHSEIDSMTVLVAKLSYIYDEFSWGLPDVVAIRYFLHYALDYYSSGSENIVSYAILAGDGTNDFRKYESITDDKNKLPPFINGTTASDDYYVYFNSGSCPDMMIGRFPCQNLSQFEISTNKVIEYVKYPIYGFWRDRIILSADDALKDGDYKEPVHTEYAEEYCADVIQNNVELIKIYGVEYPLDEFQNKPEVREDIIASINNGVAVFYYIGHGGYDVLGDEDYFRGSRDISRLNNADFLTFFVAASCNVGHFDSNTFECMAEKMVVTKDKGAIASLAASRGVGYSDKCSKVVDSLVTQADNNIRIGESILMAKCKGLNKKYILFGDPVIQLVIPPISGFLKIPDALPDDSLQARQTGYLKGTISDISSQYTEVFAVTYDTDYEGTYYVDIEPYERHYIIKGKPIFKGPVSCYQDSFSLNFIVPDDIRGGQEGHILAYSVNINKTQDIVMNYQKRTEPDNHNLIINGYSDAVNDGPPTIDIWLDRKSFNDGDYVSTTPKLFADISDSNGINITNTPGHRILLTIDDEYEENVTDKFIYNLNSYTDGAIEYKISSIEPGDHTLRLVVFDNFNLPSFKDVTFKIKEPGCISAYNVLNYPNPMDVHTYFTFYLDGDATVDIEIFTIAGKMIKRIDNELCQPGYNQIYWNGRDADDDFPANGVYFYKICLNSKRTDKVYKLIVSH